MALKEKEKGNKGDQGLWKEHMMLSIIFMNNSPNPSNLIPTKIESRRQSISSKTPLTVTHACIFYYKNKLFDFTCKLTKPYFQSEV